MEVVIGVPADLCRIQQQEIARPEDSRLVVVHDDTKELDVGGETVERRHDGHHVHVLMVVASMLVEDPIATPPLPEGVRQPLVTENEIRTLHLALETTGKDTSEEAVTAGYGDA